MARTQASRTTSGASVIPGGNRRALIKGPPGRPPGLFCGAHRAGRWHADARLGVPDSLFEQFVGALIAAASEFLLDLPSQVRWVDVTSMAVSLLYFTLLMDGAVES